MRSALTLLLALLAASSPEAAEAQATHYAPRVRIFEHAEAPASSALQLEVAYANYLTEVGAGLLIGGAVAGAALGGGSVALGFIGIIVGSTLGGVAGLLMLSGLVTLVVGAARADILNSNRERATIDRWQLVGGVATAITLGLSVLGLGLLFSGNVAAAVTGATLLGVGGFSAAFVAVPIWGEALRF